jgi:hypothetical protein
MNEVNQFQSAQKETPTNPMSKIYVQEKEETTPNINSKHPKA